MSSGTPTDGDVVWAAFVFAVGSCTAIGAIRASKRLHRTLIEARTEAEGWAREMRLAPFDWEVVDDQSMIGHAGDRAVVLRSVRLPA